MTSIDAAFRRLRASGEKGLVVYLTAGDPTPAASLRYLRAAADAGADIIEVGVPFSDPTADGPTIEAASRRALSSGMNVSGVLDLVRRFRDTHATPIVLFGYYNPFYRYGLPSLCKDAREAGVDGFLVVDLPFEERGEALPWFREAGLDWIPLAAPTSGMARVRAVDRAGSGFLYLISVTGVTGMRKTLPPEMAAWTRNV
ncbi:MAG: tryptophan synthase subunit alpha, partial [Deltaproteobacteria bacterium]